MVAKISIGNSLYRALDYNGEKINQEKGKLLVANKIFDESTSKLDIHHAVEDFNCHIPSQICTEKPVIHISLNSHLNDKLTVVELANIVQKYINKLRCKIINPKFNVIQFKYLTLQLSKH